MCCFTLADRMRQLRRLYAAHSRARPESEFFRLEAGCLSGTLAGLAAAVVVLALGAPTMGVKFTHCVIAFAASAAGLFFDSLLGATVERKGWIGNDLVNFASTAFAAALAMLAFSFGPDYLSR